MTTDDRKAPKQDPKPSGKPPTIEDVIKGFQRERDERPNPLRRRAPGGFYYQVPRGE